MYPGPSGTAMGTPVSAGAPTGAPVTLDYFTRFLQEDHLYRQGHGWGWDRGYSGESPWEHAERYLAGISSLVRSEA